MISFKFILPTHTMKSWYKLKMTERGRDTETKGSIKTELNKNRNFICISLLLLTELKKKRDMPLSNTLVVTLHRVHEVLKGGDDGLATSLLMTYFSQRSVYCLYIHYTRYNNSLKLYNYSAFFSTKSYCLLVVCDKCSGFGNLWCRPHRAECSVLNIQTV